MLFRSLDVAASLNNLGNVAQALGDLAAASDYHLRALEIRENNAPGSLDVAASLNNLGHVEYSHGDLSAAHEYYLHALEIREQTAPASLDFAVSLSSLGAVAQEQGDLSSARDYYLRALEIRQKKEPGSINVAWSLSSLGSVANSQGDLAAARDYQLRALEIREKKAPGSIDVAASLNRLGNVADRQGDLAAAREYYRHALEIWEKKKPGSLDVARGLNNLGNVAGSQGDFAAARDSYLHALEIKEQKAPGSLDVAVSLGNLGAVAYHQGDLAAARDYFLRALKIQVTLAPGSLNVADSLDHLGTVARDQDDLAAARDYLLRALEIREKKAPGSLDVAESLNNLGAVADDQGDLFAARGYFLRALEIAEEKAPGSLDIASYLTNLGTAARSRGDRSASREYYLRALEIQKWKAPGSLGEAGILFSLGDLFSDQHDPSGAARENDPAWRIVCAQRLGIAGDEATGQFVSKFADSAEQVVRTRVELGRTSEAMAALEEARAQGLGQLLSERDLSGARMDPALWSRYEAAEQAFVLASKDLAELGVAQEPAPGSSSQSAESAEAMKQREVALSAYTRARVERERLLREVRSAVPGLEARVLSFKDARRVLPPKSVYVAWAVGAKDSVVFVIPADPRLPIEARVLKIDEKELTAEIAALRQSIGSSARTRGFGGIAAASNDAGTTTDRATLVSQSRALFESLFPPSSRATIASAERVILSPDGPLWDLPFAALMINSTGEPKWLGLEKPLSYTPSLTILAVERERKLPSVRPTSTAVVVGDPAIVRSTAVASADPKESQPKLAGASAPMRLRGEASLLTPGGLEPQRLPASADEARKVAALYGASPLIGEAATEAAVRQTLSSAAIVHLATHGLFHPKLGMSSGVLLAAPEPGAAETSDNDGALQAWEFGRTLPLAAEMVVLSACETGRGQHVRGEGLIGLTRSLQAAGARSILASQWAVADSSTAELMVAFHTYLRKGVARDEALRRAMIGTEKAEATKDPFFWAAFFLTGDADRPISITAPMR